MHGNTESNVESTAEWTPLAVFPAHFSLRHSRYLNAWNRVVQGKKRLWTHNMIRIKLTPPSLSPPPPPPPPCKQALRHICQDCRISSREKSGSIISV